MFRITLLVVLVFVMLVAMGAVYAQAPASVLGSAGISPAAIGEGLYFLKINAIPGESAFDDHAGEIEVKSFTWGVTHPNLTGAAQFGSLLLTKSLDKASPLLWRACASGQRLGSVVLAHKGLGGDALSPDDLHIILFEARLLSFNEAAGPGGVPVETITLTYSRIVWEYYYIDESGGVTTFRTGWDVVAGRPV